MLDKISLEQTSTTFRFVVRGSLSPQLPLRLLGLFAQRDLMPLSVELVRDTDGFEMRIEQDGLTMEAAEIVSERIRVVVGVEWASLWSFSKQQLSP